MIALALSLLVHVAMATDPVESVRVEASDDGIVTGSFTVDATPEQVRAMLADPVAAGRLVPDVVRVQIMSTRGPCDEVVTTTRLPGTTMDYRSMRCHTSSGIRDTLIESERMQDFYAQWDYRAVEGGTEVTVKIKSVVDIPVPAYLVRVGLQSSLKATILNFIAALRH